MLNFRNIYSFSTLYLPVTAFSIFFRPQHDGEAKKGALNIEFETGIIGNCRKIARLFCQHPKLLYRSVFFANKKGPLLKWGPEQSA